MRIRQCVSVAFLVMFGVAAAAAPPPVGHVVAVPVEKAPVYRAMSPGAVISLLSTNDFQLQFKDAYLVYEPNPGGGTLQIAAELNVLSYGGDWTVTRLKPFLFHMKLNSWSGFFWKVNTSQHVLMRVTGGTFGSLGGSETAVPDVTVQTVGNADDPTRFFLRFADSYLVKPHASAHPQIAASGTVLSYGSDWTITQDGARPWVYHLSESVWKGFSWKANLLRQIAYRVTDPLNPCGSDVRLQMDVHAPSVSTGGTNDYDVFGCTWSAVMRPLGSAYPSTSPLAGTPDSQVIGKDVATATGPAAMTKVTIRDAGTNAQLAASSAGDYLGDYDLRYASLAATRSVVFEVTRLDTGDVLYRSPAVTIGHGDNPRDVLLAGASGDIISGIPFPAGANTGVFTRVGNVELAGIDVHGFASFAGAAAQWRDAPFGGRLDMFGALTQNFYPVAGIGTYCYKLRVQPPIGAAYYMTDPLYKTRYVVKSDGRVSSTSVSLGPVNDCYLLTPLSTSPQPGDPADAVAVFWSYPDLLARWQTASKSGLHLVGIELHNMAPDRSVGATVPLLVNDNMTAELYLDNTPVQISFDQLTVSGGGPDLLVNQCAIANLMNGKTLTVDYTARHANGFMASYVLSARSNSGINVWADSGSYPAAAWGGSRPPAFNGREAAAAAFVKTSADFSAGPCAYVLDITAWARTTDGYSRINWAEQQKYYYIQP